MSVGISALKSVRIFISYSTEDKKTVGSLKVSLERIGFEVFLAHEDIKSGSEWEREIIRNLKRCDIFVPFLSKNFKSSEWTDQETGMAIGNNMLIIPLQVDILPYGFIGKFQAQKVSKSPKGESDIDETAKEITRIIINDKRYRSDMKEFVISSLINSKQWNEANARVKFIEYFEEFTNDEVNRIVDGAINNNQVYGAFTAQDVLGKFIEKHKEVIKPLENYEKLKKLIKP
jgi:hypothetical protein